MAAPLTAAIMPVLVSPIFMFEVSTAAIVVCVRFGFSVMGFGFSCIVWVSV